MTVWYTSDHHFFHRNIIELCARPFRDAEEMNAALINNWNDRVAYDDTVWVLGDVALDKRKLNVVMELNGTKHLIAGNHDTCWAGHRRIRDNPDRLRGEVARYEVAGFDRVYASGFASPHLLGNGLEVALSHLPYRGDSHAEDRYADQRLVDEGLPLLCGHVHEKWTVSGRQVNVGVDVWHYAPVSEEEIISLLHHAGIVK
jgi:calcineurin-like phosphoesterase family protein